MQIAIRDLRRPEHLGRAGNIARYSLNEHLRSSHIFTVNLISGRDHYSCLGLAFYRKRYTLSCKTHAVCYAQKYDVTLISPRNYFMCDLRAPVTTGTVSQRGTLPT